LLHFRADANREEWDESNARVAGAGCPAIMALLFKNDANPNPHVAVGDCNPLACASLVKISSHRCCWHTGETFMAGARMVARFFGGHDGRVIPSAPGPQRRPVRSSRVRRWDVDAHPCGVRPPLGADRSP
jgi:hypothetical protein